jgi:hypothetical protein
MSEEEHVEKVTAEWIKPERVDDTGSEQLMMLFAGGGLAAIAGAIAAMGLYMHFLPGY